MLDEPGLVVGVDMLTGRALFPNEILLVYSRRHALGSILIRAGSWWAPWSHVGVITPEGTVIEALSFHGVVETPWEEFEHRVSKMDVVRVPCPNTIAAFKYARSQIGAGYDYGAIARFVLREPLESKSRKHCAELVEDTLIAGGNERFRVKSHLITPHQSYIVKQELTA